MVVVTGSASEGLGHFFWVGGGGDNAKERIFIV